MPTVQDTIYPRLKAVVAPQDLERVYTPTPEECDLAAQLTQDPVAYLGCLIRVSRLSIVVADLKCTSARARPSSPTDARPGAVARNAPPARRGRADRASAADR